MVCALTLVAAQEKKAATAMRAVFIFLNVLVPITLQRFTFDIIIHLESKCSKKIDESQTERDKSADV